MNWLEIILSHLPTIILVAAALFFFGAEAIKAGREWKNKKNEVIGNEVAKIEEKRHIEDEFVQLHEKLDNLVTLLGETNTRIDNGFSRLDDAEGKIGILLSSDLNDIKAWIVEKYLFFFCNQGWIDEFSMDTINRRYNNYVVEGGNSYIEGLVNQLRALPRHPPENNNQQH